MFGFFEFVLLLLFHIFVDDGVDFLLGHVILFDFLGNLVEDCFVFDGHPQQCLLELLVVYSQDVLFPMLFVFGETPENVHQLFGLDDVGVQVEVDAEGQPSLHDDLVVVRPLGDGLECILDQEVVEALEVGCELLEHFIDFCGVVQFCDLLVVLLPLLDDLPVVGHDLAAQFPLDLLLVLFLFLSLLLAFLLLLLDFVEIFLQLLDLTFVEFFELLLRFLLLAQFLFLLFLQLLLFLRFLIFLSDDFGLLAG